MKRYTVRYFIVWPPPHPTLRRMVGSRRDRAFLYWHSGSGEWCMDRSDATQYRERGEAEAMLLIAAVSAKIFCGEMVGSVRVSRQLVRIMEPMGAR